MTMRYIALASVALLHVVVAQSPNCITIYEDGMFQGASQNLCGSKRMLSVVGFNNKVSSARFGSNINTVIFYDGNNFDGNSLVRTVEVERMGPLDFNDVTSSIHIDFDSFAANAVPEPNCIFVFVDGLFEGRAAQFCQDVTDLSQFAWDNQISSVKLGSNVGRFTAYDLPNFEGERRTRSVNIERFGDPAVAFNDRVTSFSFLLNSEVPTHASAIDGCDTLNAAVEDKCLALTETAALRCCSTSDNDNFCDSFCPSNGFLVDYATAVRTCEDEGLRLCFRSEIANGDCCATGCGFDAENTWIEEDCTNSCAATPCLNGGVCTDLFGAGFECECASGWEGPTCAQDVDDCAVNPCQNGGTCADTGTNSFECTCATGWMGTTCTEDVDDCAPNPCANGGTCADLGTNAFECTCASGWMGVTCEEDVDDCTPNPCENGGTCADAGTNAFECTCATGWMGVTCTEDVDDCAPNPCANGGTCLDLGTNAFQCTCASGWMGVTCEEDVDDCTPNPCENGGTCADAGTNAFQCTCATGWMGATCTEDVDDCSPNPCDNGGACTDLGTNAFECACLVGFTGATCSETTHNSVIDGCRPGGATDVQDECLPKDLVAGVRCCDDSNVTLGLTCDSICGGLVTYDAAVAACENVGARLCTREEIGSRVCCGTGCGFDSFQNWIQEDCINYCDPHPCENGGTCFNAVDAPTFTCRCTGNWTGTTCSEPTV